MPKARYSRRATIEPSGAIELTVDEGEWAFEVGL
jgi:hypothetical protein